jgi:hypothetical protein
MTQEPLDELSPELQEGFDEPTVLAVTAVVLAVLSLAGFGLMNGTAYVVPLLTGQSQQARLLTGLLVGAALALVPVALGWRAASRAALGWPVTLGRAAVLLGLTSFVLRLVVAVVQATTDGTSGFTRL